MHTLVAFSTSVFIQAETDQAEACKKFEEISQVARGELQDLKKRRLVAFKKNLTDLADLEIKHAKVVELSFVYIGFFDYLINLCNPAA